MPLVTSDEAHSAVAHARREAVIIPDDVARTIASWWHSPAREDEAITKCSHGLPLTPDDYRAIIETTARNSIAAHEEDERNGYREAGPDAMALVALSHWCVARLAGRDTY